jgi:hypothetical protein
MQNNDMAAATYPLLKAGAGMGLGTLIGAGVAHLVDLVYQYFNEGRRIPERYLLMASPILVGILSLAYSLAQGYQLEEMRRI